LIVRKSEKNNSNASAFAQVDEKCKQFRQVRKIMITAVMS